MLEPYDVAAARACGPSVSNKQKPAWKPSFLVDLNFFIPQQPAKLELPVVQLSYHLEINPTNQLEALSP